ncbi:hypothetical protein CHELA1G11_10813 [Hyphomicrobiales bacterium]|nr:hypothetical protein CHELA1G11_10813 [Hyphomicrobiales bacterium]CAH1672089.1 hypothetical protein CHELA1G2_13496 [Hyphomicrobiales bacterium]
MAGAELSKSPLVYADQVPATAVIRLGISRKGRADPSHKGDSTKGKGGLASARSGGAPQRLRPLQKLAIA